MASAGSSSEDALLQKHAPVLVIFPQEPDRRKRPGAWRPGEQGWGDYHPCNVEFFFHRAYLRRTLPEFELGGLLPRPWRALDRTGLEEIKRLVSENGDGATAGWELDIADIPSQSEIKAWRTYGGLLKETEHAYRCVGYGRVVDGADADGNRIRALQYWYLYVYNDFRNNHEADWEMVTIELGPDGEPRRAGYSSHHKGFKRQWADIEKVDGHPLVHVALGSHAGYSAYRSGGYPLLNLIFQSNLPGRLHAVQTRLRRLLSLVQRLPLIRRWRDLAPADEQLDDRDIIDANHFGVRIRPKVVPLRDGDGQAPWWQEYRGKWGSTRPRIVGTVGIDSPWAGPKGDQRWRDPLGWLGDCTPDKIAPNS